MFLGPEGWVGAAMTPDVLSRDEIRSAVTELCARFGPDYWAEVDAKPRYPDEFVGALSDAGWLSVLIPEEYGGGGLGIRDAAAVLEAINASGANSAACHAQMYTMGSLLRHGSAEQKQRFLPGTAAGSLRLQALAVTEPDAGSDTSRITTFAKREGEAGLSTGGRSLSPGCSTPI